MNILIIGQEKRIDILSVFLTSKGFTNLTKVNKYNGQNHFDLVFDLDFDQKQPDLSIYSNLNCPLILSSVLIELSSINGINQFKFPVYGFNAIPGFIERDQFEMSTLRDENKPIIESILSEKNIGINWVKDRVGMVSPRIIFMIINEAYYTVQEKTAEKNDIDTAMKLGTNYPKGPFEWLNTCGIEQVYKTLEAVYNDTKDERYKICSTLKTEYLKSQNQ